MTGMGSEDRADRVKARDTRRRDEDDPVPVRDGVKRYARQAMVSSAQAHERAAQMLERMAGTHPEEADLHRQVAVRHRRWAENDRKLAERYAPRGGDPDDP